MGAVRLLLLLLLSPLAMDRLTKTTTCLDDDVLSAALWRRPSLACWWLVNFDLERMLGTASDGLIGVWLLANLLSLAVEFVMSLMTVHFELIG